MKTKTHIWIIILFSIFISCQNKPYKTDYYDNGNVKFTYEVINDSIRNGECIDYFENGNVNIKSHWLNGKMHGKAEYFSNNGIKTMEAYWKNDKEEGLITEFFENGKIKEVGYFENGKPIGFHEEFNESGMLISKCEFLIIKDSTFFNQNILYDENGSPIKSKSWFFTINNAIDTLKLNENHMIEITVNSIFTDSVRLIIGDLDKNFSLIELTNIDTLNLTKEPVDYYIKTSLLGKNVLRGIIQTFKWKDENHKALLGSSFYFHYEYFVIK